MKNCIIACSRSWCVELVGLEEISGFKFHYVSHRDQLTAKLLDELQPRYIFFPHWNWIVPSEIHDEYECIVFHTAPLPFGRGGSPIQNLILRGWLQAPVSALRMTDVLDGGPVYCAEEVSLEGDLTSILDRIKVVILRLIRRIIEESPEPTPQKGEPVYFARLTPADNEIAPSLALSEMYDHIRMVDSDGYPPAFMEFGGVRLEFEGAHLVADELTAKVTIKKC